MPKSIAYFFKPLRHKDSSKGPAPETQKKKNRAFPSSISSFVIYSPFPRTHFSHGVRPAASHHRHRERLLPAITVSDALMYGNCARNRIARGVHLTARALMEQRWGHKGAAILITMQFSLRRSSLWNAVRLPLEYTKQSRARSGAWSAVSRRRNAPRRFDPRRLKGVPPPFLYPRHASNPLDDERLPQVCKYPEDQRLFPIISRMVFENLRNCTLEI